MGIVFLPPTWVLGFEPRNSRKAGKAPSRLGLEAGKALRQLVQSGVKIRSQALCLRTLFPGTGNFNKERTYTSGQYFRPATKPELKTQQEEVNLTSDSKR